MSNNTALAPRSEKEVIADLTRLRQPARRVATQANSTDTREHSKNPSKPWAEAFDEGNKSQNMDELEFEDVSSSEEDVVASKERKITHTRRRANAQFAAFLEQHQVDKQARAVAIGQKDDEQQSTKWLVKNIEGQNIISSPRDYQVELFERAKEENIIAVLDTGSGKTLIAILLLHHVIDQELENRALGNAKRISFFLVDSVALVFQQYAVLETNLDQPMEQFCGNMISDHGSRAVWERAFSENMVIVCTAALLSNCLHHSFITIDRINLLIFDEAHHAKKNHVYARIIKDFYIHEENKSRRPKIFGMTASPVDSKVDVRKASLELETLLHCRIATASDPTVMQYLTKSKQEQIADYAPLQLPFKTRLYLQMETHFRDIVVLKKPMEFARHASSELGSWCADQMWSAYMREEDVKELLAKTERKLHAGKIASFEACEAQKLKIQAAQEMIHAHTFPLPQPSLDFLSSKVIRLMDYLRERFERPTDDKAIIFVGRRYTAKVLAGLFDNPNIGTPYLRVGTLVGIRSGSVGDSKTSLKQQVLILRKFRQSKINCLFATSVAEEGLDIPDCNLVIRFDLYRTVTQYIQSRGRARQANSRYIHFLERGNRAHAALIGEVKANESILRQFCQSLPKDRLLTGNDHNLDYFLAKEKLHRVYTEPDTGAKLTYRKSLEVLANFVSSLSHSSEGGSLHPEYVVIPHHPGDFICEVILPETSKIRGAIGRPHSTKQVAKCSAAFEACLLLRRGGHIDEWLQSTYERRVPAMRNALLAVTSKKRAKYDMRTKPSLWTVETLPNVLYLTIFSLVDPTAVSRPTQPIGILTRSALPRFPDFPLFFGNGVQSDLNSTACRKPLMASAKLMATLDAFTLRIFRDVFSKEYESNIASTPYFLAPIKHLSTVSDNTVPSEVIAWDTLEFVENTKSQVWDENTPKEWFEGKYLVDPWAGSRKMWAVKVTHDYKPLDPVPLNTTPPHNKRKDNSSIMEYTINLYPKARARRTFRTDQPVIEAEYISLLRNFLDGSDGAKSKIPTLLFVIPEPLIISALPATVVSMAYLFPAIIHRVESYMVALEACDMLQLSIPADLALEALTKDSDNCEEHSEEQTHVQRGMGKNYERLEFLGDCFLKMATSIAIYTQHPDGAEDEYHVKRMLLLCNKNLFNNALELGLETYIRSKSFDRRVWYPEGLVLLHGKGHGKTAPEEKGHSLGDKTVADVCEALIGAALLAHHKTGNMDSAVRAVTEFVSSDDHRMTKFSDYYKAYKMPKYQIEKSTASQRDLVAKVLQNHAYEFKYPRLLRSAFVHPSYPFVYERIPTYQRLEFLGDSLLDMACINFLFHRYPNGNPQWLTEHKMAMVSNQFLGVICVDLGFYKHLLSFSSIIRSHIAEYVTTIKEAREQAEDDAELDGRPRSAYSRDFWVQTRAPPKCLPDVVEAYIGALFIDSEYNYAEVERFFDLHIKHYFTDMSIYDTFANKHPVTFLHRLMLQFGCMQWKIHAAELPDYGDAQPPISVATIMIHEQVIAYKEGASGRYAKVAVAQMVRDMLTGLGLPEYRVRYQCDCKVDENGEDVRVTEEIDHGTAV